MRVTNDAGSYGLPGRDDHVRLFVVYGSNEVEAMRRQRAQDQVEIAERVRRCAEPGRKVACIASGAGERRAAGDGGWRRRARREL